MTRRAYQLIVPAAVLIPALTAFVGGWAVTTVEDLPDYAVAGQPLTLTYTVRQHGVSRLGDLRGTVEATAGSLKTRAMAVAAKENGQYTATLTFPKAGDWTITIHNGFGNSKSVLLPLKTIESGSAAPAAPTDAQRGQRLFAAKGCVACHVDLKVGPDLAGRTFPPDYLQKFLADPRIGPRTDKKEMPNLNLKPREIAALATFINSNRQVGTR